MVHAVSATYQRFERMSPSAVVLAVLLHGAVVVAWWWASPLDARDHLEDAIEVTMDMPAPQANPQVAAAQAPPPAAPTPSLPSTPPRPTAQPRLGLPPVGGSPDANKPAQTQPPAQAQPQPPPPVAPEPQQALAPAPPAPEPPPTLDKLLPPIATPPAPLTSRDIPKPPPAPPPPKPRPAPQPPAHQQPAPQQQALKPSPLRPPAPPGAQTAAPSPAPSVTFQNPAEAYKVNRAKDEYLWRVAQKISQYHYAAQNQREQGALVVRLVIARDGRLIDAGISRSSGVPALDKGAVETMRAASPYAPLPAEIGGAAVEFILPLNFAYRQ